MQRAAKTNIFARRQIVAGALKKPAWLKMRFQQPNIKYLKIKAAAADLNLATVCASANCPNIMECWGSGTATFMIMGDTCTRACRFCNVNHGKPKPLDPTEPQKLADTIKKMRLDYVVITCVDRDDLPDFGAAHFAKCICAVKKSCPKSSVEILAGDFQGKTDLIKKVIAAKPAVFGHNIETVKRLQRQARDVRAGYDRSLRVLDFAKKTGAPYTKSSIMVGLGEQPDEVIETMKDLRSVSVDFLTIGQYLRPSAWNLPVQEYILPQQFNRYREMGEKLGFLYVASGPFVRSSYMAGEFFNKLQQSLLWNL